MRQNDFNNKQILKYGCYLLCLYEIAKKECLIYTIRDVERAYEEFIKKKFIATNCYILQPELILNELTGRKWKMTYSKAILDCDYVVANCITKWRTNHFILVDNNKNILYDPDKIINGQDLKQIDYRNFKMI